MYVVTVQLKMWLKMKNWGFLMNTFCWWQIETIFVTKSLAVVYWDILESDNIYTVASNQVDLFKNNGINSI